jgi:Na+/H+-dicarboxylate symporter
VQVYTKILIGMLVGALVGLLLGPNSSLLPADIYKVTPWERLDLRIDRDDPSTALRLPAKPPTPAGMKPAKAKPLRLTILETIEDTAEDPSGQVHPVRAWSRVELEVDNQLLLRDKSGEVAAKLGNPSVGDRVELWIAHERTALRSGGFLVWPVPVSGIGDTIIAWLSPLGVVFMRLITMVIVPLVFASLLVGVASLGDVRKLGRLGLRTLGLYLCTTAAAVTIGLGVAHLIDPGSFIDERSRIALQAQFEGEAGSQVDKAAEMPSTLDNIVAIIPTNPMESLVNGDMLQVIFFAVLFGVALTMLDNKAGRPVVTFMDRVQEAMVVIIHIVMKVAPFGVAALVAEVVGTSGWSVLKGLFAYGVAVILGLSIHGVVVYGSIVKYLAKLPVVGFLRSIRPAQLIAFSTSSSSAALPVSMECAENLRVSKPVASFVIPLGATVNMDGTALYQGVAALFIAQVFQMELGVGEQITIVATATMASIGAAGVPGAGMVTLAMVLTAIGVPTVGVALILGVDRLLDMFRTTINVTGDLAVTAAMARSEGDPLQVLSTEADRADPNRGFERRLEKTPEPIQPDDSP